MPMVRLAMRRFSRVRRGRHRGWAARGCQAFVDEEALDRVVAPCEIGGGRRARARLGEGKDSPPERLWVGRGGRGVGLVAVDDLEAEARFVCAEDLRALVEVVEMPVARGAMPRSVRPGQTWKLVAYGRTDEGHEFLPNTCVGAPAFRVRRLPAAFRNELWHRPREVFLISPSA